MISTPTVPGHAPTRRKIARPGPEWLRLDWSENIYDPNRFGPGDGGSLFESNQIQFRLEGRFGFAVTRPAGIVELDLTA